MATTVDSTNIVSARDRAEAFFYGSDYRAPSFTNENPTATAQTVKPATPVMAEYTVPVEEPVTPQPQLSRYVYPEAETVYQPTELRSYATAPEATPFYEPQVLSSALDATQEYVAPAVTTKTQTPTVLDVELEDNTQYVVRLKTPTLVAMTAMAIIFVMLSILFVVNIVSLASTATTMSELLQEEQRLDRDLATTGGNQQSVNDYLAEIKPGDYEHLTKSTLSASEVGDYTIKDPSGQSDSFFDWLCKALGGLFS